MASSQPPAAAAAVGRPAPDDAGTSRFALDLHDGPLQELAALGTGLYLLGEDLAGDLSAVAAAHARERVESLRETLALALDELRELARDAAEAPRLNGSFSGALRRAAAQSCGTCALELEIERSVDLLPIDESARLALVHIVRSAVANAVRHSGGSTVTVRARATAAGVVVEVQDDGTGFRVASALRRAGREGRLGLLGMQERADDVGVTLLVRSRPGQGTLVVAELALGEGEHDG